MIKNAWVQNDRLHSAVFLTKKNIILRWWNLDNSLNPQIFKKEVPSTPQHTESHPCARPGWSREPGSAPEKAVEGSIIIGLPSHHHLLKTPWGPFSKKTPLAPPRCQMSEIVVRNYSVVILSFHGLALHTALIAYPALEYGEYWIIGILG